jgi:serine/threonine protein kinase
MQGVQGLPLYPWAAQRNPSSRQVLAVLAHAAGALQATHEVSGLHRDVKGDNMLVRPSDGWLFLTDFGSGYFAGADRLTPLPIHPGTPAYRSPQLWLPEGLEHPDSSFTPMATPADDVFALGVTAYRLVTDTYPPFTHPSTEEGRCWLPEGAGPRPPRLLNPRVDAQLNALILRMLSSRPEERGLAGELAQALLRGVAHAGPSADAPLFEWESLNPSQWTQAERAEANQLGHRPLRRDRKRASTAERADRLAQRHSRLGAHSPQAKPRSWLPWLAAMLALGLWPAQPGSLFSEAPTTAHGSASSAERDAVSLGEDALSSSAALEQDSPKGVIAAEMSNKPLPGQRRPDAQGRCPNKHPVINGGCWIKVDLTPEDCLATGYLHRGGCYVPIMLSSHVPTSAPQER